MGIISQMENVFLVVQLVRFALEKINVQLVLDLTIITEESASFAPNPAHSVRIHLSAQAALQQAMLSLLEAV